MVAPVLGALKAGVLGVAGAIRTATAASLAFIATPVGAAIAIAVVAVAALTTAVVFLADKVGGFGNLAAITFAGIKAAVVSLADVWLASFTPIAAALDGIIAAYNAIPLLPDIDVNVSDSLSAARERLDASGARAEFRQRLDAGLAEGRAQDAAGTSLGQRLNPFGGGDGGNGGNAPAAAAAVVAPSDRAAVAPAVSAPAVNNQTFNGGIEIVFNLPNVRDASGFTGADTQAAIERGVGNAFRQAGVAR